jgi:hypothetical protein
VIAEIEIAAVEGRPRTLVDRDRFMARLARKRPAISAASAERKPNRLSGRPRWITCLTAPVLCGGSVFLGGA